MPTTSFVDFDHGIRSMGARTDAAGTAVADLSSREDALVNGLLAGGIIKPADAFNVTADGTSMTVTVGSGSAFVDLAIVESAQAQQPPYLVRLDATSVAVTLDASGAGTRIDQLFLVPLDDTWDSGGVSLARIGYRKGDEEAGPPGPDSGWSAHLLLATITVAGGATEIFQADVADGRVAARFIADLDVASADLLDTTVGELDTHVAAANPHSGSAADPHGQEAHDGSIASNPHGNEAHSATFATETFVNGKVVTGSYVGDGTADRLISLPASPKYVVVNARTKSGFEQMIAWLVTTANNNRGQQTSGDESRYVESRLGTSGFRVWVGDSRDLNTDGVTYDYVAFL